MGDQLLRCRCRWLSVGCALHTTGPVSPPKGETCNYLTDQIWGRGVVSGRFASALPAGFKVRANKWYFQAAKYPFFAVMGAIGNGAYGQSSNSDRPMARTPRIATSACSLSLKARCIMAGRGLL